MSLKSRHTFIGGPSDSGKTTLLREHHARFDGHSIYVNHGSGRSEHDEHVAGYVARNRAEIHRAFERAGEFNVKVDYRPTNQTPTEAMETATSYAVDFGDTVGTSTGTPCQVLVDEAHKIMPDDANDPADNDLAFLLAEGRDKGIKAVLADQNPKAVAYGPLENCRYFVFVGPPSVFSEGFFRYFSGFDKSELPARDFGITVMDRSGDVLHKGETDPEYGDSQ